MPTPSRPTMNSTISTWYHNQYASWNRMRRMHAPQYLARSDTRLARTATGGGAPGDTVINMGDLLPQSNGQQNDKKNQETLFGPSIGTVNPGPSWAEQKLQLSEKAQLQDVLTAELVKGWVEKSKSASQPTTTLQALVNLKRPTLRLSPISHAEPEDGASQPQQHGLEFQFDCDAPKCGISLHVIQSKDGSPTSLVEVYHAIVDGGFGRTLKLEEGATLELDKFDCSTQPTPNPASPTVEPSTELETPSSPGASALPAETTQHKKRFTLRIRRRTHPTANEDTNHVTVAGPALQIVDVEMPAEGATAQEKEAKEKSEGGVKVLIKIEALDADGHTHVSPNSQATYLHIVRLGSPTDTLEPRPWVVRVVKREATIGPHTFHLHEIYGLSSHAPLSSDHAYPPTTPADTDDPTSECLLCLSSPREVVLLPCRHLVACKECAVNMVEFGAGGQLVHSTDDANAETGPGAAPEATAPAQTPGEGSGAGAEGIDATSITVTPILVPTPAPTRPANPRRKRKAKGWFCPVCRQPYTSLLRISTTAPRKQLESEEGHAPVAEADSPAPLSPNSQNTNTGSQRPGFLRALSNAAARVTGSDSNNAEAAAV